MSQGCEEHPYYGLLRCDIVYSGRQIHVSEEHTASSSEISVFMEPWNKNFQNLILTTLVNKFPAPLEPGSGDSSVGIVARLGTDWQTNR